MDLNLGFSEGELTSLLKFQMNWISVWLANTVTCFELL